MSQLELYHNGTEFLATDVFETLLEELKKADVMSIAADESTDRSDTAQLCPYVLRQMLPRGIAWLTAVRTTYDW